MASKKCCRCSSGTCLKCVCARGGRPCNNCLPGCKNTLEKYKFSNGFQRHYPEILDIGFTTVLCGCCNDVMVINYSAFPHAHFLLTDHYKRVCTTRICNHLNSAISAIDHRSQVRISASISIPGPYHLMAAITKPCCRCSSGFCQSCVCAQGGRPCSNCLLAQNAQTRLVSIQHRPYPCMASRSASCCRCKTGSCSSRCVCEVCDYHSPGVRLRYVCE